FLGDDESPVENDLVKLVDDLRDNVVNGRAQAEKCAVVGCASALDSVKSRAAIEDELGGLELYVPRLVLDGAATVPKRNDGGPAAIRIWNLNHGRFLAYSCACRECFLLLLVLRVDYQLGDRL